MTTQKQNSHSHLPSPAAASAGNRSGPVRYAAADDGYKPWILLTIILIALGGAALVFAQEPVLDQTAEEQPQQHQQYQVSDLPGLGGTNSRGNSINNRDWVAGYSNLPGNQSRHATLWRDGSILDLGTLGGPNSNVTWNVKNERGIIVGIAQTAAPQPLGEFWSSAAFYPGPNNVGYINLGFVWEDGVMRALPTLGGDNGFATGANKRGQVVGWAENTVHDPTCVPPQVLQFRPVNWNANDQIHEFPLIPGDTSGAATAINDKNQAVGISGICDQAVGRYTAKHAVLWNNGRVIDLGNLGAPWWNTPTAINQKGDIVGFAGDPAFPDGDILHAFIWTEREGIRPLGALPGHVHSEAYGINKRRQVVGLSCDANFVDCRAFVWENGVMRDLNDLKDPGYSARLEHGKDINDHGDITGRAIDPVTGVRTAFLALP
jgi:probable HAF family extracellular repeat protein